MQKKHYFNIRRAKVYGSFNKFIETIHILKFRPKYLCYQRSPSPDFTPADPACWNCITTLLYHIYFRAFGYDFCLPQFFSLHKIDSACLSYLTHSTLFQAGLKWFHLLKLKMWNRFILTWVILIYILISAISFPIAKFSQGKLHKNLIESVLYIFDEPCFKISSQLLYFPT